MHCRPEKTTKKTIISEFLPAPSSSSCGTSEPRNSRPPGGRIRPRSALKHVRWLHLKVDAFPKRRHAIPSHKKIAICIKNRTPRKCLHDPEMPTTHRLRESEHVHSYVIDEFMSITVLESTVLPAPPSPQEIPPGRQSCP